MGPLHWDLKLTSHDRDQMIPLLEWLAKEGYCFEWSSEWVGSGEVFYLEVTDMPWGNNLKQLTKQIRKLDEGDR